MKNVENTIMSESRLISGELLISKTSQFLGHTLKLQKVFAVNYWGASSS